MPDQFEVTRGDTFTMSIAVVDEVGPFDLSGSEILFAAKYSPLDLVPVIAKSSAETGVVITSATEGLAVISFDAIDTEGLDLPQGSAHRLVYDIKLIDQLGAVSTIADGELVLLPSIG